MRESKNLSQARVAEKLGISQSSYNDLEQGHTKLKVDTLILLAQLFEVDTSIFLQKKEHSANISCTQNKAQNLTESDHTLTCKENQKIILLLQEQKLAYDHYRCQNDKFLSDTRDRLKKSKLLIRLLLLSNISIPFVLYFEKIVLWLRKLT